MAHHGTLVVIELARGKTCPISLDVQADEAVQLLAPAACAHPITSVVESIANDVMTLRTLVGPGVVFEAGSPVQIQRLGTLLCFGKVK